MSFTPLSWDFGPLGLLSVTLIVISKEWRSWSVPTRLLSSVLKGTFITPCHQTMLPDRSLLIGQKLVKNAKIEKFKCDILSNFQTFLWAEFFIFQIHVHFISTPFCNTSWLHPIHHFRIMVYGGFDLDPQRYPSQILECLRIRNGERGRIMGLRHRCQFGISLLQFSFMYFPILFTRGFNDLFIPDGGYHPLETTRKYHWRSTFTKKFCARWKHADRPQKNDQNVDCGRCLLYRLLVTLQHLLGNSLCLKITQNVAVLLAESANFCLIKIDLSGNTVWPQASIFGIFNKLFCSLCSQYWMRLFLGF